MALRDTLLRRSCLTFVWLSSVTSSMVDKGSSDAIISLRDKAQFCFSAVEACHQLPDYKVASLHRWLLYVYHLRKLVIPFFT